MTVHIPYETSDKPWFGPRRRARELLKLRNVVLPPSEALETIKSIVGPEASAIQRVRFIDYVHRGKPDFRYTIALVWTFSNSLLRQALYSKAEELVRATGWYPLPQGERIASRLALHDFRRIINWGSNQMPRVEGELLSIENAVGAEGGCAIRVRLGKESLLLDSGLPGHLQTLDTDRAILLSHFHLDHSGGLLTEATHDLSIVMSRSTAQMLLNLGRLSETELKERAVFLDYERPVYLGDHIRLLAFRVPHCPGSTGFELSDGRRALFFSGDLALRTARHDFSPTLLDRVARSDAEKRWVMLDATMAGRPHGATAADAAGELLEIASHYDDVIVVSQDAEQLIYAYLDLFFRVKDGSARTSNTTFLLSKRLKSIFRILHAAYIEHRLDQLDPFLAAQYGASMSAWAESRWLYWLDSEDDHKRRPEEELRLWFISEDELAFTQRPGKVALVPVGRTSLHGLQFHNADVLDIDSAAWTLHSDEESLRTTAAEMCEIAEVVLFHNFSKRLRKFVRNTNLDCKVLSRSVQSLV